MKKIILFYWMFVAGLLISACASAAPTGAPAAQAPSETEPARLPGATATLTESLPDTGKEAEKTPEPVIEPEEPPLGAERQFITDFSKHSVPYQEILSGGPPKDGIPAIDNPRFVGVDEAEEWLEPVEPVIFVQVGEDSRAYPLQILTWHEIVNDTVGEVPLIVTFCPLCNTAIAFERTVNGGDKEHRIVLDFGTTGRLRFSNLIMYDRQTETWWQQATGEAIVGEMLGTRLEFYPAAIISWEEFRSTYPDGRVLSRDTGFSRPYGENPYGGYDDIRNSPFLYRGPETPDVLPPVARVLTVDLEGEAVAYPYDVLEKAQVVNDQVAGKDIVVIWEPGTASALDASSIAEGRDVGTANAYLSQVDGRDLTFRFEEGRILDEQTGSEWNILGQAVSGELQGQQLEPVVAINHFWFSWAAFKPETRIYQP